MMFKTALKTSTFISITLLFCAVDLAGNTAQYSASTSRPGDLESLKSELSKYRTWTLVNPKPVLMNPVVATACAAPGFRAGPHTNKYISVYVNDAGREAMMSKKYPRFPKGSIIVKEKLSSRTSTLPELLTIMVKRGEGFDQGNGNWEYLVINGDGSRLERPTNVASCQACHLPHKETDFVSRVYLPNGIRDKLK